MQDQRCTRSLAVPAMRAHHLRRCARASRFCDRADPSFADRDRAPAGGLVVLDVAEALIVARRAFSGPPSRPGLPLDHLLDLFREAKSLSVTPLAVIVHNCPRVTNAYDTARSDGCQAAIGTQMADGSLMTIRRFPARYGTSAIPGFVGQCGSSAASPRATLLLGVGLPEPLLDGVIASAPSIWSQGASTA